MTNGEKYHASLLTQKAITQHLIASLDMAFDLKLTKEAIDFRNFLIRRLQKIDEAIEAYEFKP